MKDKITLDRKDFCRVLLTDVLPYEIPFILTNEGFYKFSKNKNNLKKNKFIYDFFTKKNENNETNPLIYRIAKDNDSSRNLFLIHPKNQLQIVELYKNYNQLISHLCSRSTYSLRHPSKIAYTYQKNNNSILKRYEDKFKDEGVGIDDDEPMYASTFFEYKEISFLYKFYDSYQFHRIEKKFDKLFKFDIAKCFSSISTFYLSKSIREIQSYHNSIGLHSFENLFQKIMENCYFGNSHGLVVGPEFSRIFSEILLQSIDIEIKKSLKNHVTSDGRIIKIKENTDYVIKRYVDDYFLFYNNEDIGNHVYKETLRQLEKFKLYINESKNTKYTVPFITGVTIAKQEYRKLIESLFSKFGYIDDNEIKKGIKSPMHRFHQLANQLITDIKCIVYKNKISYSAITGYYFTLARNKVCEIHEHIDDYKDDPIQSEKITNFLIIIIELSFFIHSMDFRVRSTYLISQIIILINKISENLGVQSSEFIKKKIYDEAYLSIRTAIQKNNIRDIECLNLIISIRDIDINYQLNQETIEKIIGLDRDNFAPNYFSLMTCLFYIQNKKEYLSTRTKIVNHICTKLSDNYLSIYNDSELAHIFFDSIRCPYITRKMKTDIVQIALKNTIRGTEVASTIEFIESQNWFIDWDCSTADSIERLLMKKELKAPYDN
ncbi:TPA: antiviral reverse transcriptase Drt3b [Morganella morganii]|nr:RNA-directed DNA polymerase [Morganella morganii]